MIRADFISRFIAAFFIPFAFACCVRAAAARGPVDVYDGFETKELSKIWDTSRLEPGTVEMQTKIFRAGRSAEKITVHAGNKFEAGLNGNSDSERTELMEARGLVSAEARNYEYVFSLFFPTDFPTVPTRLVVAQWKQYCPAGCNCFDDSPVLAIRYISGELLITQDLNKRHIILYRAKEEFRGRWLDFKFQVSFSSGEKGHIQAWIGRERVVDYHGVTANAENATSGYPGPSHFYFKMGLYRNVMKEPMTLYIDEYRKKELPMTGD